MEEESADNRASPATNGSDSNSQWESYTIPSYTRWFTWNGIHDTERNALREFFDGSSPSKTPEIYKEYRDFMINKYRENPLSRLTFTQVRKMLVGDTNSMRKVFDFLDSWGLINFQASSVQSQKADTQIVIDNGVPSAIRVVLPTQSVRRVMPPAPRRSGVDRGAKSIQDTTFVSHKDIFVADGIGEAVPGSDGLSTGVEGQSTEKHFCNNCRAECEPSCVKFQKGGVTLCMSCLKDGNSLGLTAADMKYFNHDEEYMKGKNVEWTDQETLLLLEGTLYHGNDWKKISEYVGTKNEAECVMKLIHLPFGVRFMEDSGIECNDRESNILAHEKKENEQTLSTKDSTAQNYDDGNDEGKNLSEENVHLTGGKVDAELKKVDEVEITGQPSKSEHESSFGSVDNEIMSQIAHVSTIVGPHIIAAATEAAIAALSQEEPSASWIFSCEDSKLVNFQSDGKGSENDSNRKRKEPEPPEIEKTKEKVLDGKEGELHPNKKRSAIPHVQMRAAIAVAFGAAAAHAKLLADQEEREMQYLVSVIIENQVKKLQYKVKHFEELEAIMEKQHIFMEQEKELLLAERIQMLKNLFR
eukprot:TRINITY_DN17754_c1_g1_i1.p1 TRINITY_DN17754_c1_g1~~TRINITY_DN17754_c1_g1_i1.p1  ORF type:complete len:585 (+),score=154.84 TRINITY_DN17754_c1_g1_i1:207-1961(+)